VLTGSDSCSATAYLLAVTARKSGIVRERLSLERAYGLHSDAVLQLRYLRGHFRRAGLTGIWLPAGV